MMGSTFTYMEHTRPTDTQTQRSTHRQTDRQTHTHNKTDNTSMASMLDSISSPLFASTLRSSVFLATAVMMVTLFLATASLASGPAPPLCHSITPINVNMHITELPSGE